MLLKLNNNEIKLYSYLWRLIGAENEECWASQKYITRNIGKKCHSTISKITDQLVRKKYINK